MINVCSVVVLLQTPGCKTIKTNAICT